MITGPTSGIGREFALRLAKEGFSIYLIGRDEIKLEKIKFEIESVNKNVQVKRYKIDFNQSLALQHWEDISLDIQSIDPAILVNNVGVGMFEPFLDTELNGLKDFFGINCLTIVMTTKIVIEKMLTRPKRSAIININCTEGLHPIPYISLYSSSKAFGISFTRSLDLEYGDKIDILSYTPFKVLTNLSNTKNNLAISPETTVDSCFRVLGKYRDSAGFISHRFVKYVRSWYPSLWTNFTSAIHKDERINQKKILENRFMSRKKYRDDEDE